jgi:hypothetical protein
LSEFRFPQLEKSSPGIAPPNEFQERSSSCKTHRKSNKNTKRSLCLDKTLTLKGESTVLLCSKDCCQKYYLLKLCVFLNFHQANNQKVFQKLLEKSLFLCCCKS